MIVLTDKAVSAIRDLASERAQPGQHLRMKVLAGGCSGYEYGMQFDMPVEDDVSIERDGVRVLVDPSSLERLKGVEIDFDDGLSGKGFEIRNPNAQSTCGCGRSFN